MKKKNTPVRLNANENFYGSSPKVLKAVIKNTNNISIYPASPVRLEQKLAEKFKVDATNIVVGGGSVRLIDGIIQSLTKPDDEIICFERSFVAYAQLAEAHRRKCILVPQKNFICIPENILPHITKKTKVIFLANPNNPTGTIITHKQLEKLLQSIPETVTVVLDEAYAEYVTDKNFPKAVPLFRKYPNLIIIRTFSKIYGLAGLRIGFGIAHEKVAGILKKNRIPFFFNSLCEDAALTALEDEKYIQVCAGKNATERKYLLDGLQKLKLKAVPSQGNYIFVWFDSENQKDNLFKKFIDHGLLICNLNIFGQSNSLRIGIGNRKVNNSILKLVREFLK
jgi:histidinol-phosphate aminotransferase